MRILRLTTRDLDLFQKLKSLGMMTTEQIKKAVFTGVNRATILRRLRKLRKEKYLQRFGGLDYGLYTWALSKRGAQTIGSDCLIKSVNRNVLKHDVMINDVRFALESHGIGENWISGHELKMKRSKNEYCRYSEESVPDSVFSLKLHSGLRVVAMEVALSAKSRSRYKEIFQRRIPEAISFIWYVVPTEDLGRLILEEKCKSDPSGYFKPLYWTLLSEILERPNEIILRGKKGEIKLKEILARTSQWNSKKSENINSNHAHPYAHRVGTLATSGEK